MALNRKFFAASTYLREKLLNWGVYGRIKRSGPDYCFATTYLGDVYINKRFNEEHAHFKVGDIVRLKIKHFPDQKMYADRARRVEKFAPDIFIDRAQKYLDKNHLAKAHRFFRTVSIIDPSHQVALDGLRVIHEKESEKIKEAERLLKKGFLAFSETNI